jgi:PAS domain S-box-containing protein
VDIDAFKGSLEELKESRDYAESIIETIWEPLLVLDEQLRVKTANRSFYNTFRVSPDETKGSSIFDLGNGQWQIPGLRTMLESLIPQNGRFQDFEVEHEFPRIGQRTMLLNGRVIYWEKNRTQMVLLAIQDITQRKQVEVDRIKASLREKEVLLKEVHHRVKNNLQIISSLLRLQSETQHHKPPLEVFRESQDRIRSMALIHEKLYHSQDLSKIDFSEYVRNLASNLFLSYDVDPTRIELDVNMDDVSWDVGTAIPCGLIINELISNALKYAFPGARQGKIRIELRKEGEKFVLIVADDGVGFPKDLDVRNTESLGFQLVSMLSEQLNGTMDLHTDGKTEIRITFLRPKREENDVQSLESPS